MVNRDAGNVSRYACTSELTVVRLRLCSAPTALFLQKEQTSISMKPYESNSVRLLLRQAATNPAEATVVTDSQTSGWNSGGGGVSMRGQQA